MRTFAVPEGPRCRCGAPLMPAPTPGGGLSVVVPEACPTCKETAAALDREYRERQKVAAQEREFRRAILRAQRGSRGQRPWEPRGGDDCDA